MGSVWVNLKSERQACRLEPQGRSYLLSWGRISSSSGFALKIFDWVAEATAVLRVTSCKFWWWMWPSPTKYLHRNIWTSVLLNHWRLVWPNWQRKLATTVPIKLLSFEKSFEKSWYVYKYCVCSPLGFALKSVICAMQNKWSLVVVCVHDRF